MILVIIIHKMCSVMCWLLNSLSTFDITNGYFFSFFVKVKKAKNGKTIILFWTQKKNIYIIMKTIVELDPKVLLIWIIVFLYLVHDTLFERPNCFQLVERPLPCMSTVYYMCSSSYDILQVSNEIDPHFWTITNSICDHFSSMICPSRNGFKPLNLSVFNNFSAAKFCPQALLKYVPYSFHFWKLIDYL